MTKKQSQTDFYLHSFAIKDIVETYNHLKKQGKKIDHMVFTMKERTLEKNSLGGDVDINHSLDCDFRMEVKDKETSADGFKKSYTYDVAKDDIPQHFAPITMMVESPVGSGYIKRIESRK